MNELALDPTETRRPRAAAETRPSGRPLGRIALASALGVAGLGAFAAASAFLSDLTGSRGAPMPPAAARQSAADWPDLMKDGLPALATGSLPAADAPRRIALPAVDTAADAPTVAAPAQATAKAAPELTAEPAPALAPKPLAAVAPAAPSAMPAPERAAPPKVAAAPKAEALPAAAAKSAPAIENAPVIAPVRQAGVVPPPNRTAPTLAARPAETVRARTASTSFAALPAEPARPAPEKAAPGKQSPEKAEARTAPAAAESRRETPKPVAKADTKADPRTDQAGPAKKPVAAGKAPTRTVASAEPAAPAEPEETEVFGIKVPTLAATGRKIGASVEALGDAVKGLPDRF